MIASPLPPSFDWESAWLTALKDADNVTVGNNPVLASILQQCWGWQIVRIFFKKQGQTAAIFSALKVGKKWVSLPHFDQGSLWWNPASFRNAEESGNILWNLIQSLLPEISFSKHVNEVNLEVDLTDAATSNLDQAAKAKSELFIRCTSKFTANAATGKMISCLFLSNDKSILQQMPAGPARKIRKAIKNGLEIRTGGAALLHDFYSIYRENIQRLGSFGLPLQFFKLMLSNYRHGEAVVVVCYHNGNAIGASILLTFAGYAENLWFATARHSNRLYTSYLLHYTMLGRAQQAGCNKFSFGRSTTGGGVHRYKQQFGAEDIPLYYNQSHQGSQSFLNPDFLRPLIRQIPLPFARLLDLRVSRLFY